MAILTGDGFASPVYGLQMNYKACYLETAFMARMTAEVAEVDCLEVVPQFDTLWQLRYCPLSQCDW